MNLDICHMHTKYGDGGCCVLGECYKMINQNRAMRDQIILTFHIGFFYIKFDI